MTAPNRIACCKVPPISDYKPRGEIRIVDGIDVYVAEHTRAVGQSVPRAILFLPEVHGINLPHAQRLADNIAEQLHCPVIAPDLYRGSPMPLVKPEGWDDEHEMEAFLKQHNPETVDPILEVVVKWIQNDVQYGGFGGVDRLGAIGYCFGGRYVMRLMASRAIRVGVANHPSFFEIDEIKALANPNSTLVDHDDMSGDTFMPPGLAVFAAQVDDFFPETKRNAMEEALKETGILWMCVTFSALEHGFSIRPENSIVGQTAYRTAMMSAVAWFDQYFDNDCGGRAS